jgi:hypothetical protein
MRSSHKGLMKLELTKHRREMCCSVRPRSDLTDVLSSQGVLNRQNAMRKRVMHAEALGV